MVNLQTEAADTPRRVALRPGVVASGSPVSFRAVFDAECGYVWATLRRLGVAERDIEDVAHETFLRVAAHLHAYDPARPLRAWLFVFAMRMAKDYRRLARHRHEAVGAEEKRPTRPPQRPTRSWLHERHTPSS